ncbi:MAG TPA: hypothetical protein ENI87_06550 [bacterium]|nr:hypothetical protein [bacterium]
MHGLRVETMKLTPSDESAAGRAKAEKVANQFEDVFVQTLVASMRQTASIGGEDGGGMFGGGPGADTYSSWFDANVSSELTKGGGFGIAAMLLRQMEQRGEIDPPTEAHTDTEAGARLRNQLRTAVDESIPAMRPRTEGVDDDVLR